MTASATLLPRHSAEFACWPGETDGQFLVRNRQTGETFELGEQEHFLLTLLDGGHSAEQLQAEFTERFGLPLSDGELQEFIELGQQRDLLQREPGADVPAPTALALSSGRVTQPVSRSRRGRGAIRRFAAWLLIVAAGALQRMAKCLSILARRTNRVRVTRVDYVPRVDDVFIVTYPRSGTTWMQMILYQLTTDGRMDFPHIAEFCPWFENSVRSAQGFGLRPSPRLFKSHLSYRAIPKGPGRYIYVVRDGKDVAISYYHLCRRYNGYEGTFDEFFERFLKGKVGHGSWFKHVAGWRRNRRGLNVLFLGYEDLIADFDSAVRKIADFCGCEISAEQLARVKARSSFEFMKQHEHRFDPALEALWEEGVQLEAFLRNGRLGEGKIALDETQAARFDHAFLGHRGRTGITRS